MRRRDRMDCGAGGKRLAEALDWLHAMAYAEGVGACLLCENLNFEPDDRDNTATGGSC